MRGNPILRATLLAVALAMTAILVRAVTGDRDTPPLSDPTPSASRSDLDLIPALLTLTLSSPAESISFVEPSGRTISIPGASDLFLEHETELAVTADHLWQATLLVTWQDPTRHNFLRLDFEPDHLKSTSLTIDFRPNLTEKSITANFDPASSDL